MGLDRTVRFVNSVPSWDTIRDHLVRVGESGQLRMIDGLPAFPDESPAEDWKELRVGTVAGMVTIRRTEKALTCIIWGNVDAGLNAAWAKVTWACAAAGNGLIDTPSGPATPDEFAASAGISAT